MVFTLKIVLYELPLYIGGYCDRLTNSMKRDISRRESLQVFSSIVPQNKNDRPSNRHCGSLHKRQFRLHSLHPFLVILYTNQSVDLQAGHLAHGRGLGFRFSLLFEHRKNIKREGDALQNILGLFDAGPNDGHELGNGRIDDVLVETGDVMEDLLVEGGGILAAGGFGHDGHGGRLVQAEDGPGQGKAPAPGPGVLGTLVDAAVGEKYGLDNVSK